MDAPAVMVSHCQEADSGSGLKCPWQHLIYFLTRLIHISERRHFTVGSVPKPVFRTPSPNYWMSLSGLYQAPQAFFCEREKERERAQVDSGKAPGVAFGKTAVRRPRVRAS